MMSKRALLPIGLIFASALFLGFNIWLLVIARLAVPFFLFMTTIAIGVIAMIRGHLRDRIDNPKLMGAIQRFFNNKIGS
jgi:hypothetical protein